MNYRTYIVTGGNSGIGKAIALGIARGKANRVVLISRSPQKGADALAEIREKSQNDTVELVVGDLGTIENCHKLASELLEQYPKIHVLINNAAVWMFKRVINEDGLEMGFMVNHVAPFILSNLLLDRLKESAPARIVNVNMDIRSWGKVDLEKTPYGNDFSSFSSYVNSKLCNLLFTVIFDQRIQGSGVTINAVHPGVVRTNIGIHLGWWGRFYRVYRILLKSPEKGAQGAVWLATSPELDGVNGKFFVSRKKQSEWPKSARDRVLASKLWSLSIQLAGLGDQVSE
jgi:NAD(P)-dependent dehydrogenase (short-subunit alcohol dehydrogenase family)